MSRNITNISIRMDADLKSQVDSLFSELGLNLSTAFSILYVSRFVRVVSHLQ